MSEWYIYVTYAQAGYGPEVGEDHPGEMGPFDSKEEAERAAEEFDRSPFGVSEPYQREGERRDGT
jgi:hypothetical protein